MPHSVRYTSAASAEVAIAICCYDQPDINQAASFARELERTKAHLTSHPELYQGVEGEITAEPVARSFCAPQSIHSASGGLLLRQSADAPQIRRNLDQSALGHTLRARAQPRQSNSL